MLKQYKLKNYKFTLIFLVAALTILGILLIGSAQPDVQKKQILGFAAGLVIMLIVSVIDYSFILKFSWLIYLFMVGILALVRLMGDSSGGAPHQAGFSPYPSSGVGALLQRFPSDVSFHTSRRKGFL